MPSLKEKLEKLRIVAVVSVDNPSDAVDLAETLCEGGINAVEMTLRSPNALRCIEAVVSKVSAMCVGAGTVLTQNQAEAVSEAGAAFAVAPGCNARVLEKARELDLPFAPGIMTPSDIEKSLEFGLATMKFFPAESSGGIKHLESMAAPYKHLGVSFLPLGGLNAENMKTYLSSPLVCAIGGSWIAPAPLIKDRDWKHILQNARSAVANLS